MHLSNIKEGQLKGVFDALEEAFSTIGIDYYLVGAQARDVWYTTGGKRARLTNDIDFAILVGSEKDYEAVKDYLKNQKNFQETKSNSFVMFAPGGIQVDILPFGGIEIDDGVKIAGEGLTSIKVNGFLEVYQSGTQELEMDTGHSFKIATLPSIVLLKLIAFDDRPEQRIKDAIDIANIISHYFDLQTDLIYDSYSELFLDEALTLPEISAIVIGREIRKVIDGNQVLLDRIKNILLQCIELKEQSLFVRMMITGQQITIDSQVVLLRHLYSGIIW